MKQGTTLIYADFSFFNSKNCGACKVVKPCRIKNAASFLFASVCVDEVWI